MESNSEFEMTKKFTGKVFRTKDIEDLIDFFHKTIKEISDDDTELRLWVYYKDGSSVRGSDVSILNDTKSIESLYFFLSNFMKNKRIKIKVSEHEGDYSVESYDEDWVRAKVSFFEEYLAVLPKQNVFLSSSKSQFLILNILGVLLGAYINFFFLGRLIDEQMREDSLLVLSVSLVSFFFGMFIAYFLTRKLYDLYPAIEFDTTREHLNKKKKTKSILTRIFVLILIPFVLNFISDIFF